MASSGKTLRVLPGRSVVDIEPEPLANIKGAGKTPIGQPGHTTRDRALTAFGEYRRGCSSIRPFVAMKTLRCRRRRTGLRPLPISRMAPSLDRCARA